MKNDLYLELNDAYYASWDAFKTLFKKENYENAKLLFEACDLISAARSSADELDVMWQFKDSLNAEINECIDKAIDKLNAAKLLAK